MVFANLYNWGPTISHPHHYEEIHYFLDYWSHAANEESFIYSYLQLVCLQNWSLGFIEHFATDWKHFLFGIL